MSTPIPSAVAQATMQARATESGYTMAAKWCLRCDVGWVQLGVVVCWLCGKDDETHVWKYGPEGPRLERVRA